ncbi:hypothetical protein DIPPA_23109 [Diplonema papillatum]|nr:hypothetical protein DIPPA_23109 [Diplonema papillatum]
MNFDSETVGYFERSFAKLVQPQLTDSAGSSGDEPQEQCRRQPKPRFHPRSARSATSDGRCISTCFVGTAGGDCQLR